MNLAFIDAHLLTLLTLAPLLGAVAVALFAKRPDVALVKGLALVTSAVTVVIALRVYAQFDETNGGLQLVEKYAWVPTLHVDYFLGVDGLSLLLVLLTAIVVPLALLAAPVTDNARGYVALVLLMQTAMFGAFLALSFFHWFIFWELSLVPAFFLIKMFGGPDAHRAAVRFFLITLVGSVTMLLAFQAIYLATGTLDLVELANLGRNGALQTKLGALAAKAGLPWSTAFCGAAAFAAIALAFAVKAPLWPFHTWLPDAYAEAPPSTTMLLTAVLSKMGVYGFLRIALPLFPDVATAALEPLLVLAVITVVAGAFSALAQTDLKRMAAFSSVNHVGYCLVGLFAALYVTTPAAAGVERAAALNGVLLQMFNHGIGAAAMFFLLGALERRTNKRGIDDFGGLRRVTPVFAVVFGVVLFSSLGLPGLAGFVGELLIFKGTLAIVPAAALVSTLGIVVTAVFLLRIMQRVWWGPLNRRWQNMPDLSLRERIVALPFLALILCAGLYPAPFASIGNAAVVQFLEGFASTFGGAR